MEGNIKSYIYSNRSQCFVRFKIDIKPRSLFSKRANVSCSITHKQYLTRLFSFDQFAKSHGAPYRELANSAVGAPNKYCNGFVSERNLAFLRSLSSYVVLHLGLSAELLMHHTTRGDYIIAKRRIYLFIFTHGNDI